MSRALSAIHTHALDFWMARASVLIIIGLQLLLINRLSIGPIWLVPVAEIVLLVPLSLATAWAQELVVKASEDHHWHLIAARRRLIRTLAVTLTAFITFMNLGSLMKLVAALLDGHSRTNGQSLLLDAVDIWAINVIAFGLWYWSVDHGGPAARGISKQCEVDFLFPQMERNAEWSPGFIDYLFLSYTNATAFSPTDTMPLSGRAKSLMMVQSAISLLTIALVAARAVNILA